MEYDIITRDAYSVSWAEIWEFSKSQRDIIDAVTISKNIFIWDNSQYCLLGPRSPSKPVMLTFDLQSRKVLFIYIVFWHVQPRKTIMILAFSDETLPLQFAPGVNLS